MTEKPEHWVMRFLRTAVQYGYMPVMLVVLPVAAYGLVAGGYSYLWLAPLLALGFALAAGAEKIAPFFEEWNEHGAYGDGQTNLLHTLVYESSSIQAMTMIPLIAWIFPYKDYGLWPLDWPLWAQVAIAFFVADFAFMMMHYLSHRFSWLWRLHAVHHGVGRLYGFNGVVRHPLHQSLDMIIGNLPLVIMGMPVQVAVMLGFLISIALIVQHSNVDAKLGPLQSHLSIGRNHHLHHVNWGTEGDCNFGLFLTVWDKLLGTYSAKPSRPITATDMGIDELPNFPKSYLEQLMLPFRYRPGAGEPERYRAGTTPAQVARLQVIADAAE